MNLHVSYLKKRRVKVALLLDQPRFPFKKMKEN
jgi:hypothetical protein